MGEIYRPVRILEDKCKGCYLCIYVCPKGCLEVGTHLNIRGINPPVLAHPENCISCQNCAVVCPDTAIEIYKLVDAG